MKNEISASLSSTQELAGGPPLVFISYSHKDEVWKDRLRPHLEVLERQGQLAIWDDRQIDAGAQWHPAILEVMERCQVAVCLISADYLSSEFCTGEELPALLKRRQSGDLAIIPILLRSCDWQDYPWLEELQMLPRDGKSVANDYAERWDSIFTEVASRIRLAIGSPTPEPRIFKKIKSRKTWVTMATIIFVLITTGFVFMLTDWFKTIEVQDDPEILSLTETAEMHELVGRFCSPPGSNAYDVYRMILELSPSNQKAKDALTRLDCSYIDEDKRAVP